MMPNPETGPETGRRIEEWILDFYDYSDHATKLIPAANGGPECLGGKFLDAYAQPEHRQSTENLLWGLRALTELPDYENDPRFQKLHGIIGSALRSFLKIPADQPDVA
jgi:hypothetical protein